eukprot:331169-Rhodomonas_salina.1
MGGSQRDSPELALYQYFFPCEDDSTSLQASFGCSGDAAGESVPAVGWIIPECGRICAGVGSLLCSALSVRLGVLANPTDPTDPGRDLTDSSSSGVCGRGPGSGSWDAFVAAV